MDSEQPKSPAQAPLIAELSVRMDLVNHGMQFTMSVPNLEIALAMARWAADEVKRHVDAAWAKQHGQRVIVASGPLPKIAQGN